MLGAAGGIRTPDARLFRPALYPLSYRGNTNGAPCGIQTRGFRLDRPALWSLS